MTSISWTKGANIPGKRGFIWGRWDHMRLSLVTPRHVSKCLMMLVSFWSVCGLAHRTQHSVMKYYCGGPETQFTDISDRSLLPFYSMATTLASLIV